MFQLTNLIPIPTELSRARIHAGIRINYPPHLGTYFVLGCCFLMASKLRNHFGLDCDVLIQALDNAPIELIGNSLCGLRKPLYVGRSREERLSFIDRYYLRFLQQIAGFSGISFRIELYTDAQFGKNFRGQFLRSLARRSDLKWCVSALHALAGNCDLLGVRFPCHTCGLSTMYGETTELTNITPDGVVFRSTCQQHGPYENRLAENNGEILDLQKVLRNVIKEAMLAEEKDLMNLIVKGSDWLEACSFVDEGLRILGFPKHQSRIFLPVLTTESGTKLSKSAIHFGTSRFETLPEWITHSGDYFHGEDAIERLLHVSDIILESNNVLERSILLTHFQSLAP